MRAGVLQHDLLLPLRRTARRWDRRSRSAGSPPVSIAANDLRGVLRRDVAHTLRSSVSTGDQRSGAAQSHAADGLDLDLVLHARFGDLHLQGVAHLVGCRRRGIRRRCRRRRGAGTWRARRARFRRSGGVPRWSLSRSLSRCAPACPAGPILPMTALSSTTAGASPQDPRQRAVSTRELAVGGGLARLDAVAARSPAEQGRRAFDVARGPGADHAGVFALAA